jgi:hypothetical protein
MLYVMIVILTAGRVRARYKKPGGQCFAWQPVVVVVVMYARLSGGRVKRGKKKETKNRRAYIYILYIREAPTYGTWSLSSCRRFRCDDERANDGARTLTTTTTYWSPLFRSHSTALYRCRNYVRVIFPCRFLVC